MPHHFAIGSINSPMQCMMKEICAQCLQPQRDPQTGEVTYVFSCFNQDQPLDCVDFHALSERLRQNSLQEKLTAQWIAALPAGASRGNRRPLGIAPRGLRHERGRMSALRVGADRRGGAGVRRRAHRPTPSCARRCGAPAAPGARLDWKPARASSSSRPTAIDWVIAYLGAIWAGGVAIGVNPRLAPADLAPILTDSEVRFVWCDDDDASRPAAALAQTLPDGADRRGARRR